MTYTPLVWLGYFLAILLATLDKAFVGAIPAQVGIPVHFKILFFINIP